VKAQGDTSSAESGRAKTGRHSGILYYTSSVTNSRSAECERFDLRAKRKALIQPL
jgi:hypothetical protein